MLYKRLMHQFDADRRFINSLSSQEYGKGKGWIEQQRMDRIRKILKKRYAIDPL